MIEIGGLAIVLVLVVIYNLDKIIAYFKHLDPEYQKQQAEIDVADEQERNEIAQQLVEWIGLECLITSPDLGLMLIKSEEIYGTIMSVDPEWVEIRTIQNKQSTTLIIKIDSVWSVSRIL